jgi:hypothetical protein
MRQPGNDPNSWREWLLESGISAEVARQFNDFYRAFRSASVRPWLLSLAAAVLGCAIGTATIALVIRPRLAWGSFLLVAFAALLATSATWWLSRELMRRSRVRPMARLLTGHDLPSEDPYVGRIVDALAAGLAEYRPPDEPVEFDQLTQATMLTGLREAPVSELERSLMERLAGSSFVTTAEGSIFLFRLGPSCSRCSERTRAGALRLLNVPSHWAAENGYPRLKDLPNRGRYLRVVPQKVAELTSFLAPTAATAGPPVIFGPKAEVFLCDACARTAINSGVLVEHAGA